MRTRIPLLLATALAVGFAPAPFPKKERTRGPDPRSLQGTWVMTEGQVDGMGNYGATYRPSGLSAALRDQVQIAGNRLTFPEKKASGVVTTWTIHLAGGNAIDLEGIQPGGRRLRLLGLYKLEGDTLTLCICDQGVSRPMKFVGIRSHNLVILRRK
jgi:uncharacterized protein (TIGR03067 family)